MTRARLSARVRGFTESVIREMTRVVAEHGGVNLAQGMPNFPPPPALVQAAHRALDGDFHQYAITWGAPRLRRAIADKYRRVYGMDVDPERHVTVCCGSTETMLATLLAVLDPGDQVIVFEPFYENYGPGCLIAGAEPVWVPLEPPDFSFDAERLARAVTPRTRAVIFNSPNNPSGKVFSRAELQAIADVCLRHDLVAITDEIYEHIVYDGFGHTPIATLPGMADRTVTISGISKSYSVTGWRIGYAVAPPGITLGIRRAHDFVTVGAPHPLQEAAVTALELPDAYYVGLREAYQARRDLLLAGVERAGFVAWKPRGAYYILTEAAHFIKALGLEDDTAFAMYLVREIGVATVPGSSFYAHPELGRTKIRFCFPKTDDVLKEAGERLQKLRAIGG
ncbi:MAG TPA: aminotransferase class I/II-fold pyridoxal phosphate-dependent enzyme [Methylomirabilota bacterium]|nr:aminotransferase class I/II-fold pyridoxal phosphate-dependent enzyme [Methylomirabilota bacterium]